MNNSIKCQVSIRGCRDGFYYTDVYEFTTNKTAGEVIDFSIRHFKECHKFAAVISISFAYR